MTQGFQEGSSPGEAQRLQAGHGWVLAAEFDSMLADILAAAGLGDEFRRALPPPRFSTGAARGPAAEFGDRYEAVYVISVAARLVEMHPNTLRKYDREGLVRPSRSEGRQRLYSETDVQRLRIVRTLAERYGINLNGVRLVLDLVRLISGVVNLLENSEELRDRQTAQVAARELRNMLATLGA
jgi:MerR family transcriptional regulator/heat shock protein HspR